MKQFFKPNNSFDQADLSKNSGIAAIGYIIFFLPLLINSGSRLCKHTANHGLILLVLYIAARIIGFIPLIGWIIRFVVNIAVVIVALYAAYKTANRSPVDIAYLSDIHILDK